MAPIYRLTFFKIADEEGIEKALAAYGKLVTSATKDGKPYLLEASASKLYSDPRSQGFTVAGKTRFASIEDMKYYDEECEGHAALKKVVGPLQQGVLSVYMDE